MNENIPHLYTIRVTNPGEYQKGMTQLHFTDPEKMTDAANALIGFGYDVKGEDDDPRTFNLDPAEAIKAVRLSLGSPNIDDKICELKINKMFEAAGTLAACGGLPRRYGQHFGFHSERAAAMAKFYAAYDKAKAQAEEGPLRV